VARRGCGPAHGNSQPCVLNSNQKNMVKKKIDKLKTEFYSKVGE
jgi:hypothetical protein